MSLVSSECATRIRSMAESGSGIIVGSTSAQVGRPSVGQCTTPCSAGMKASVRCASLAKSVR